MEDVLFESLKMVLPAIVVFLTAYFMMRFFTQKEENLKMMDIKKDVKKDVLPIRLQAYERLTLLITRIAPENMLPRVQKSSMSASDLKTALIKTIKTEFEHNIVQQLYISEPAWEIITSYRHLLISLIKKTHSKLDKNAKAMELSEGVLNYFIQNEDGLNADKVLKALKLDVTKLF